MTPETSKVSIDSGDYWFKIIESLQQNWALINRQHSGVIVWFFGDTSGVFDDMTFASAQEAETALRHNSFSRFTEDAKAQQFIVAPRPPFHRSRHPNA